MRRGPLVLLATVLLSGCNYEQMFLRYCFETGACRCTGGECCAERAQECGEFPCCDGMQCNASGVCEGDVQLVFEPNQFILGEVPPARAPIALKLVNSGERISPPIQLDLSPDDPAVVLDASMCSGKILQGGESCDLTLTLEPHPPGVASLRVTASAEKLKAWVDFEARWGAGLAIDGDLGFGAHLVSDPPGLDCPGTCDHRFPSGVTVTISAAQSTGISYVLQAPCAGGLPCAITLDREVRVPVAITPWLTLDVDTQGLFGRLRVLPDGQTCEPIGALSVRCQYALAGQVILRPEVAANPFLGLGRQAWADGPCKGQEPDCALDITAPTSVATRFAKPNHVALTEVMLSSIGADGAGADSACQTKLPGSVAWVFTSTHDPRPSLANVRGWVADGYSDGAREFLDSLPEVLAGRARTPVGLPFDSPVFSGLRADGGLPSAGEVCGNLSQTSGTTVPGSAVYAGTRWFNDPLGTPLPCASSAQVVCFEAKQDLLYVRPAVPVRRAFVSTPWIPVGGVAGADQHCGSDAAAAGLTGPFRALVGPTGATAAERFQAPSDATWATVTEVPLYRGISLAPFLNIDAQGRVVLSDGLVSSATFLWSDGPNDTDAATCRSWNGGAGATGAVRLAEGEGVYTQVSCATAQRLLCFEDD